RPAYPYDLSDADWAILEPLVPAPLPGGRPPRHPRREIVNAILDVRRTGCQWRALPHDLPPWGTIWWYFRQWREAGVWEQVNTTLREQARVRWGREPTPSAAILDSQSARTTEKGGPRGFDWGKKVRGRKRHILVDTEGLLLKARVHPADETEAAGGQALLTGLAQVFPRLALIWIDGGYKRRFVEWVGAELGWRVEVVQHPEAGVRVVWVGPGQEPPALPRGFRLLKRRWVVERTFAWLGRNRRLSKDYEALPTSEEAWIYAASSRLLVRRLAR
ncbi:MAG: IS5 family transposase, partial [Gemmatimonadales bacterium]